MEDGDGRGGVTEGGRRSRSRGSEEAGRDDAEGRRRGEEGEGRGRLEEGEVRGRGDGSEGRGGSDPLVKRKVRLGDLASLLARAKPHSPR